MSSQTPIKAQKYLFSEPRHGGFKFKSHDPFDITNTLHFSGTGMLAYGFYKLLRLKGTKHSKLKAGLLASGLGFLKEFEDGYREGWGHKDVMFNELGIISYLLLSDYLHFTATFEQVISSDRNYGIGIRYFKTSEVTPLNASVGLFYLYTTQKESELGVDLHFFLLAKSQLHLGFAFVQFKDAAVFAVGRPNLGIGFKLF
ncbi:MAG: hypothetical protein ACE5G1_10505 [bacterium]